MTIHLVKADITTLDVDAIVNAANESLLAGGGVCGAIHRAAGPGLEKECLERYPEGCITGSAVVTRGHNLKARFVVHAVGPRWRGGTEMEDDTLKRTYMRALQHAHGSGIRTIAFPSISTGIFGFPADRAAEIAIEAVKQNQGDIEVTFCCFSDDDFNRYRALLPE
jgi:O-acetyl-ADP-ribose deacetylase (regulator of RNase III)